MMMSTFVRPCCKTTAFLIQLAGPTFRICHPTRVVSGPTLHAIHRCNLSSYAKAASEISAQGRDNTRKPRSVHRKLHDSDQFGSLTVDIVGKDSKAKSFLEKKGRKRDHVGSRSKVERTQFSDVFGTLSEEGDSEWRRADDREERESMILDDQDRKPYQRLSSHGRRNTPYWYAKKIEHLGKEGKVREAIKTLEIDMLKEDRVMPTVHVYSALIGILGRAGYTKKAFQLFNEMKKGGLVPDGAVYTGLFNACANSPWKEDGLRRANRLRETMRDKEILANGITYKSMIKVYAIHGELQTAFGVLDESVRQCNTPDEEAFSFLLMACISDKEAGFKHAIEVWRTMRKFKLKPNTYHYNLLLRATRDCGIGSQEFANTLVGGQRAVPLQQTSQSNIKVHPKNVVDVRLQNRLEDLSVNNIGSLRTPQKDNIFDTNEFSSLGQSAGRENSDPSSTEHGTDKENSGFSSIEHKESVKGDICGESTTLRVRSPLEDKSEITAEPGKMPNILNPKGKWRHVVGLAPIENAEQRLALLGGGEGILSHMAKDTAQPDVKTFSQLLDIMPSDWKTEEYVIQLADKKGVKLDTDFFSLMMRRRNLRGDFSGAKDLLVLMAERKLYPNIRTFGCLAMGCKKMSDGLQLINNLSEYGLLPNLEIFNILFYQSNNNFYYKLELCKLMKKYAVLPEERTLMLIENKIGKTKQVLLKAERPGYVIPKQYNAKKFRTSFKNFMLYYKMWLQDMEIDIPDHPWKQYQESDTLQQSNTDD